VGDQPANGATSVTRQARPGPLGHRSGTDVPAVLPRRTRWVVVSGQLMICCPRQQRAPASEHRVRARCVTVTSCGSANDNGRSKTSRRVRTTQVIDHRHTAATATTFVASSSRAAAPIPTRGSRLRIARALTSRGRSATHRSGPRWLTTNGAPPAPGSGPLGSAIGLWRRRGSRAPPTGVAEGGRSPPVPPATRARTGTTPS